jgi:hypothetical protein
VYERHTYHPLQGEDSTHVPGTNLSDCVARALSAESSFMALNASGSAILSADILVVIGSKEWG